MKPTHAFLALAALAGVLAAALWWPADNVASAPGAAEASGQGTDRGSARMEPATAQPAAQATAAAPGAPSETRSTATEAGGRGPRSGPAPRQPALRVAWPVTRGGIAGAAGAPAAEEPLVPVKLAFRALWYLGVDPEAERTWSRAINDANLPEGVRSDLIVDMVDEGYTDNNRPGKADLPVILARLEILERHAPYAMDLVNQRAFEEAYRTLLEMYVKLGGAPRNRR
jgi:hypothetical protein